MQTMSRKEALSLGLNKYFTGKPCRNGHVAERYAQSAGCQECINGNRSPVVKPEVGNAADTEKQRESIRLAKLELAPERYRVWNLEIRKFERFVCQVGQARYPGAPDAMFMARKGPTRPENGSAMHEVQHHPEDAPLIFAFAKNLRKKYYISPQQLDADIARIHRSVESFVNTTVENEINAGYNYDKLSIK